MSTHVAPVALPAPESAPKSGAADARPDVGPVLPLSSGGGEHGDLLGAADHPSEDQFSDFWKQKTHRNAAKRAGKTINHLQVVE
jgi:hypothetical protein